MHTNIHTYIHTHTHTHMHRASFEAAWKKNKSKRARKGQQFPIKTWPRTFYEQKKPAKTRGEKLRNHISPVKHTNESIRFLKNL